jgi:signal transduction histidine kinase
VDNVLVGIVRSLTDGTILFVNGALARAAGFDTAEEMMADGALPRYKNPEEREEMIRRLREDGRVEAFPTTIVTKNGEIRYGLVSARLDGNVLTSVVLDNTEQRAVEEKLKQYSARLEEMVEERTLELRVLHEKLVRRERLATLGQLAGGVGHELRNPLGAIRNAAFFLGMALDRPDPEVREAIEILNEQVTAADRIIGSLLDFARRDQPELREVALGQLAGEVLDEVEIPAEITVERRFDPHIPTIRADPVQLRQVIGNLVLNAIQAMPDGGALAVGVDRPDPAWVVLSVSDTGTGIAEENRARIFTPLFTTRPSGIGLGLANSKRFVELHGGTIRFRDRRGPGTVFSILLPVGGPEAPEAGEVSEPHRGSGAAADGVRRVERGGRS